MSNAGRPPVPRQAALNTAISPQRSSGSVKIATATAGTNQEPVMSSRSPSSLLRSYGSRNVSPDVTSVTPNMTTRDVVIGPDDLRGSRAKCGMRRNRASSSGTGDAPTIAARRAHRGYLSGRLGVRSHGPLGAASQANCHPAREDRRRRSVVRPSWGGIFGHGR